jgi:hypothetical protein
VRQGKRQLFHGFAAIVAAFADFLDDLGDEGGQIALVAAGDDAVVGDDCFAKRRFRRGFFRFVADLSIPKAPSRRIRRGRENRIGVDGRRLETGVGVR